MSDRRTGTVWIHPQGLTHLPTSPADLWLESSGRSVHSRRTGRQWVAHVPRAVTLAISLVVDLRMVDLPRYFVNLGRVVLACRKARRCPSPDV